MQTKKVHSPSVEEQNERYHSLHANLPVQRQMRDKEGVLIPCAYTIPKAKEYGIAIGQPIINPEVSTARGKRRISK